MIPGSPPPMVVVSVTRGHRVLVRMYVEYVLYSTSVSSWTSSETRGVDCIWTRCGRRCPRACFVCNMVQSVEHAAQMRALAVTTCACIAKCSQGGDSAVGPAGMDAVQGADRFESRSVELTLIRLGPTQLMPAASRVTARHDDKVAG